MGEIKIRQLLFIIPYLLFISAEHGHYVETFNANRKPTETAYREELIYTGFTYQCKQFGQVRSDGAGIRPRQT